MSPDWDGSWDVRPKAGWEEFRAARARFQARLAAQTEVAQLERLLTLELPEGTGEDGEPLPAR